MRLPENLSLPMVADVMEALGVPVDCRNVGRALQGVVIAGVEAPEGPGGRWRIPRSRLVDVAAACLHRRRRRSHARTAYTLEECLLDAAQMLMRHDELHAHVPKSLQRQVVERRQARLRAEQERQERAEEAERRRVAEQEAAWRRKQAEERELYERIERAREREAHERVTRECYRYCFCAALKAMDLPRGGSPWIDLPEAVQVRRDFPHDRPAWWSPPPGLYEAVKDHIAERERRPCQEPDLGHLIPSYVPGAPWPWRRPEAEDDADGAGA